MLAKRNKNVLTFLKRNMAAYLFILPPLVLYGAFVLYPLVQTIGLSFTNWDGVSPTKQFVGWANYARMLKGDKLFARAFTHNLYWILLGTVSPIVIGLILAALLATRIKGRTFFRTVYFMPSVLSTMVVGIIWGWIYNPVFGLLNEVLKKMGLETLTRSWLGEGQTALTALIIAAIWSYFGFCVVVFLAGLQNIDVSLYEAAQIDGANGIQRFFHITIPGLREVITMVTTYTLIGGFRVFDIVWVTTRGGPANATEVMSTYIYRNAFQQNYVGYGAAMALTLSTIIVVISIAFIRVRERSEG